MLSVGDSPDGLSGVGALRKCSVGAGVKILLDECVPRQLDQVVTEDECATPQDRGWAGLTNGELLRRAKKNLISSLLLIKTSGINKTSLAHRSPFFSSQQTICVAFKLRLPRFGRPWSRFRVGNLKN